MTSSTNSFYVTLFSNASREIYENNNHAYFTVKLLRPIDLGTSPIWEVGVFEVSCSSPASLKILDVCAVNAMIYCNLNSPQFVGESTVRCLRTFPATSCRHNGFWNVQYAPVEQRQFQSIRIEFLKLEVLHFPFEDSVRTTKVVFHFRNNYQW